MDQTDHRSMIRELLEYDGESGARKLTQWEIDFLESVSGWAEARSLTTLQARKLEGIWSEVFG